MRVTAKRLSRNFQLAKLDRNGKMLIHLLVVVALMEAIGAFQPEFVESISNVSVAVGRDATFTCHVRHLGGYRVGWLKADTKAIQAIHENVITHNPRVTVSHLDQNTWNLHIKAVSEEDRGGYMCQLNTDPMKSQIGFLDVVIPPDFISEDTSSDVIVPEGSSVRLTSPSFRGEVLKLSKISRNEMGSYLCIASNGVPPSVSKRISLSIHFHPVIQVPNQLVGAPLGTDVQIECHVEASPKSINYWIKDTGEMIVTSGKYHVQESSQSMYETKMSMIVRKFQKDDVGSYRCIAKNSLGEVDSSIRLYEIPGPNRNKNPLNGGGKGGGGGGGSAGGSLDADANDILKQKQQVKVTYQPEDEELQYGSAEDFETEGGENGGLTPLSPHVYYTSGNKPATHKPGNSGGNQHQHQHQQHHHHNHHHNNQHGGGGSGSPGGGLGSPGGEMGGITRKPPPYYGGNTEVRGPIDNNEMSSGSGLRRGHHLPLPLLLVLLLLLRSWHCRQPFLMGLSTVSGLLLGLL
ncbi:hypothetical protein M5D96_013322 [Drosophila gunungcola]|uniref:Ig-like domain-containing protein n=1 Tax=Drosophila gunungcola TaxID=103775 RepID=A0A9Q0BJH3_9MUSC|nr:hypothetical protein M5D96_013322 [Drosophila gunungcola]